MTYIYLLQDGERTGPFPREEVYRQLVAGKLKGTDLGWHPELAEWEPLLKIIPPHSLEQRPPHSLEQRPQSRLAASCKQLLKSAAVLMIAFVISFIVLQTFRGPTANICVFFVLLIGGMFMQKTVLEIRESCSNCKRLGTMQDQGRELLGQNIGHSLKYETAEHRNRVGRLIGYSKVPLERTVVTNHYERKWVCSHCGYTKTKTERE